MILKTAGLNARLFEPGKVLHFYGNVLTFFSVRCKMMMG